MSNTLLTVNQITRKALMILEQKLNFIGNMNRQYDSSFAQTGAKIGDSLRIRLPNQYLVRSGATLSTQDTLEQSITLQVSTQKGVDTTFSSAELTLSMDDFAERILNPAMSVLAASMEADAFNMLGEVPWQVGSPGTVPADLFTYLEAKRIMDQNLAPMDDQRTLIIPPIFESKIVDALKGLFQSSSEIADQYRTGKMGKTAGFNWYTNTLIPRQTLGSNVTGLTVSGTLTSGASTMNVAGTSAGNTFKKGQVFTVGVKMVHPQTKQVMDQLMPFTITADVTATGATTAIAFSPAMYISTSGGLQNIDAMPPASTPLAFSSTANAVYNQAIAFQKDAFTFASADLVMPQGVDFSAREVWQNLSMRVVRQYDINSDKMPTRIDVLYGYKTLRPQLACRVVG
jgi:hypothetical protein